jgi:hypothetical protein
MPVPAAPGWHHCPPVHPPQKAVCRVPVLSSAEMPPQL